tara:strand:- start:49 stop:366 length:318 start_codon:yes stop_codon:yes gene_type:complete
MNITNAGRRKGHETLKRNIAMIPTGGIRDPIKANAALSGSVRPVVTYLIIIEFLAINWAIAWVVIAEEGVTVSNLKAILDTDFMGLVSCVVAFWFGNRTFGKRKT